MTESKGRKGFFVVFGPPGRWKSSSVLETFQNALVIASEENLDQFYMNWILKQPQNQHLRPPKRTVVIDQYSINGSPVRMVNGQMYRIAQRKNFENAIEEVTKALSADRAENKPPRFANIIVDEGSIFWDRFLVEISTDMTKGRDADNQPVEQNRDGRAHHGALQTWTRQVIDRFRTVVTLGANLVMVCHDTESDGKRKGGPQMPNVRVARILAAAAHIAVLSDFETPSASLNESSSDAKEPRHVWLFPPDMLTKARGVPLSEMEKLKYEPLSTIVKACGYEP